MFDILKINGEDLTKKTLKERKKYLENFKELENIKVLDFVEGESIITLWEWTKKENKEGIILKLKKSPYEFRRSNSWKKLKNFKEEELRIIRYTINNAGIRAEDKELNAVQIAGTQSKEVKKQIDEKGYCDIMIQYLDKSEMTNRYRMPSYRGMKRFK
ncbi:hypothetical protein CCP1ISM_2600002 [Azospirillaceae bacterium]